MASVSWAPVGAAIGVALTERKGAPHVWHRIKLDIGGRDLKVSPSVASWASGGNYNAAVIHLVGDLHLGVLYTAPDRMVSVYVLGADPPNLGTDPQTAHEVHDILRAAAVASYERAVLGKNWTPAR